ncbi:MAG: KilA-N domain-containing protein [Bacteroidota bacterium]
MAGENKIIVEGRSISYEVLDETNFFSLNEMVSDSDHPGQIIQTWIRLRSTLEYLKVWEKHNNPSFHPQLADTFIADSGKPTFTMTPTKWATQTSSKGIFTKRGRYGGTWAHVDIALEFAAYLSPKFRYEMILSLKEVYEIERNILKGGWSMSRFFSKINYHLQTNAIKEYLEPRMDSGERRNLYASEADLVNVAVFGITAKQWREENPELSHKGQNIRDQASMADLVVLANLESANSQMIEAGLDQASRLDRMQQLAVRQYRVLSKQLLPPKDQHLLE